MPLYEYECGACGRRFEIIQKFSDPPPETCRLCGKGPARRLMSSPAIQFKGTGFYITDYAQKGKSDDSSSKTPEKKDSDTAKSETTKSDSGGSGSTETSTKSETKSDTAGSSTSSASTSGTSKESTGGRSKE